MFNSEAQRAIEAVADAILVPRDALLAVVDVESNGVVFTQIGGKALPVIRWEGHYFDRFVPAKKREQARKAGPGGIQRLVSSRTARRRSATPCLTVP